MPTLPPEHTAGDGLNTTAGRPPHGRADAENRSWRGDAPYGSGPAGSSASCLLLGDVIDWRARRGDTRPAGTLALRAAVQPVRSHSGALYGAELLVRRDGSNPAEGAGPVLARLAEPEDWFALDVFMLNQAARLARANLGLRAFVNLSVATAREHRLRDRYLSIAEMQATTLAPASLVVEIDERFNASVRGLDTLIGQLHEVKASAALDDFHASAECWRKVRAEWDCIKIDCARLTDKQSLDCLRDLTQRPSTAHPPLLVAEAVETNELARDTLGAGAHFIQGYVAGRPRFPGQAS